METLQIISPLASPIIVGIILAIFNKKYNKKSDEADERAKNRREESYLGLKMASANGALAYAVAIAVKRGKANGEVEQAVKEYEESKKEYYDFINRQHFDK